jgi:hypothetical protein
MGRNPHRHEHRSIALWSHRHSSTDGGRCMTSLPPPNQAVVDADPLGRRDSGGRGFRPLHIHVARTAREPVTESFRYAVAQRIWRRRPRDHVRPRDRRWIVRGATTNPVCSSPLSTPAQGRYWVTEPVCGGATLHAGCCRQRSASDRKCQAMLVQRLRGHVTPHPCLAALEVCIGRGEERGTAE